jgi:hypothetical protein
MNIKISMIVIACLCFPVVLSAELTSSTPPVDQKEIERQWKLVQERAPLIAKALVTTQQQLTMQTVCTQKEFILCQACDHDGVIDAIGIPTFHLEHVQCCPSSPPCSTNCTLPVLENCYCDVKDPTCPMRKLLCEMGNEIRTESYQICMQKCQCRGTQ